jgi:ABC-type transporter Mla maintaining outer membrane lipid asymmetry permease subunit MlaE
MKRNLFALALAGLMLSAAVPCQAAGPVLPSIPLTVCLKTSAYLVGGTLVATGAIDVSGEQFDQAKRKFSRWSDLYQDGSIAKHLIIGSGVAVLGGAVYCKGLYEGMRTLLEWGHSC